MAALFGRGFKQSCRSVVQRSEANDEPNGHGSDAISNNNDNKTLRISATSMPDTVYSLVWDFLLCSNTRINAKTSFDLKTISSFMLVSKTSMEAFHECKGWKKCVVALQQEATYKREVIVSYQNSSLDLKTMDNVMRLLAKDGEKFLEAAGEMRMVDVRLARIAKVLLPEARFLASMKYPGDGDCDSDSSFAVMLSYESTLEKSIQEVERLQDLGTLVGLFLGVHEES